MQEQFEPKDPLQQQFFPGLLDFYNRARLLIIAD